MTRVSAGTIDSRHINSPSRHSPASPERHNSATPPDRHGNSAESPERHANSPSRHSAEPTERQSHISSRHSGAPQDRHNNSSPDLSASPTERHINNTPRWSSSSEENKISPTYSPEVSLSNNNSLSRPEIESMPGEKKKGHEDRESREENFNGGEEWMEMNGYNHQNKSKSNKNKKSGKTEKAGIKNLTNGSAMTSNNNNRGIEGFTNGHSRISGYDYSGDNSFDFDLDDPGPHREMAIDVPDNFIASIKSPPRFPPPGSTSSTTRAASPAKKHNKQHNEANSQLSVNSGENNSKQPTREELQRLHRLEDELKKRREEESKQQAEDAFLRASLRSSKKLQALENRKHAAPAPVGFDNRAYDNEAENDEYMNTDEGQPKAYSYPRVSGVVEEQRYLKKNLGVEDLFSTLHHIRNSLTSPEDQKYLSFMRTLFQNEQFQQAVSVHSKIVEITSQSPPVRPMSEEAVDLSMEVQEHLNQASVFDSNSQELDILLNKPHFKSLLEAHDTVSQQFLKPSEDVEAPDDMEIADFDGENVRIIRLEKTNEPLGATVKNEGDSVLIARIVKGGIAEKSGLLHEGDEVLDVNGYDMRGRNINEVSDLLANMTGTITFMVIPGSQAHTENHIRNKEMMHLRALFSYDPEDDQYIPCKELGVGFFKGDILHAIALEDPNWWQAYREGEQEDQSLAGLIPSKSFTEQREAVKNAKENKENKRKARVCACGRKERKKKKKKKYTSEDSEEILTYEEIAKYYPQPNRKRPIVLIGPQHVGLGELRDRLLESNPDRFGIAVNHTSKAAGPEEVEGNHFHFVSRIRFQAMIEQGHFIEYGEHSKDLFGTTVDSVRDVVSQGKVCLLIVSPQSLKVLRESDLKPYVIFVSPPNLEKLRQLQEQLRRAAQTRPLEENQNRTKPDLDDEQLKCVIDEGREIEEAFGHLFDFVFVNADLDRTYQELVEDINRIEMEPQWVPAAWINSS